MCLIEIGYIVQDGTDRTRFNGSYSASVEILAAILDIDAPPAKAQLDARIAEYVALPWNAACQLPPPHEDDALTFDQVEAAGLDGTLQEDRMSDLSSHVIITDRTVPILRAVEALLRLDAQTFFDQATGFTCTEIEAVADLYRANGDDYTADAIIEAHAEGDDEGDDHQPIQQAADVRHLRPIRQHRRRHRSRWPLPRTLSRHRPIRNQGGNVSLSNQVDREKLNAEYDALPDLPADGTCACGSTDFYHIEEGYSQWCRMELDAGTWRATTDGWDDMSETGMYQYVTCHSCDADYKTPTEIEWN